MSGLSRRTLLGAGASSVFLPSLALARPSQAKRGRRPKNVIWLVSDGMSVGVPSMLDHYLQMTEGRPSHWRKLQEDPEAAIGLQDTRSLSSLVTDSAAASSSWGAGRHVWNGMINEFPDGTKLTPLYALLGARGVRRGLVSTATITHATPAGFAVSIADRDREEDIARLYLDAGVEVLMGGGDKFFAADRRKDGRDVYADFAKAGYRVVKNRADLLSAAPGERLLGVFSPSHVPYAVDRENDEALKAAIPSLPEMMGAALARLRGGREGFVLQVEAGRVDHAAHNNDLAGAVFDQREFDGCIVAALDFARADKETLVVVTSDHGNSNPAIIGSGPEYGNSTAGLALLGGMRSSYEAMLSDFATGVPGYDAASTTRRIPKDAASVDDFVKDRLGVTLTEPEAVLVADALNGKSVLKGIEQYGIPSSMLAIALGNHTHVGWSGRQHTDDYTLVSAWGPGAERFEGLIQNTSVFDRLLALRGMRHANPTMSAEDARRAMERGKEKALAESVARHAEMA